MEVPAVHDAGSITISRHRQKTIYQVGECFHSYNTAMHTDDDGQIPTTETNIENRTTETTTADCTATTTSATSKKGDSQTRNEHATSKSNKSKKAYVMSKADVEAVKKCAITFWVRGDDIKWKAVYVASTMAISGVQERDFRLAWESHVLPLRGLYFTAEHKTTHKKASEKPSSSAECASEAPQTVGNGISLEHPKPSGKFFGTRNVTTKFCHSTWKNMR